MPWLIEPTSSTSSSSARIVTGVSFAQFMYTKRYCSDARIVGVRRRTALAGWLVVGQSACFTVGPFAGGLLYKIGIGEYHFQRLHEPRLGSWQPSGSSFGSWLRSCSRMCRCAMDGM